MKKTPLSNKPNITISQTKICFFCLLLKTIIRMSSTQYVIFVRKFIKSVTAAVKSVCWRHQSPLSRIASQSSNSYTYQRTPLTTDVQFDIVHIYWSDTENRKNFDKGFTEANAMQGAASSAIIQHSVAKSLVDNAPNYLVGCVIQKRYCTI